MYVSVVAPADAVVTWDEAKQHLRLDADGERALVESLIAAAMDWLSGPNGWLGRSIGSQTLEARFAAFAGSEIVLPYGPVTGIVSINYLDQAGTEQTLSEATYQKLADGRVVLREGQAWPLLYTDCEAVRVRYVAGDAPAAVKAAILLLVGHWFENREAAVTGTIATALPLSARALLEPYRKFA